MSKFRINTKMFAGFLVLAGLLLAGGVITIFYTYYLHQVTSDKLQANIHSPKTARKLQVALFQMRGFAFNYVLDEHPRWLRQLEQERKNFYTLLDLATDNVSTSKERVIVRKLSAQFRDYESNLHAVSQKIQEGS